MDESSQAFVGASDAAVIRHGLEDGASKSLEMAFLTPPEKSTFSKGLSGASPQQPKLAAAGADGTLDSDVLAAAEDSKLATDGASDEGMALLLNELATTLPECFWIEPPGLSAKYKPRSRTRGQQPRVRPWAGYIPASPKASAGYAPVVGIAGAWGCSTCGIVNFKVRRICNRCSAPRPPAAR